MFTEKQADESTWGYLGRNFGAVGFVFGGLYLLWNVVTSLFTWRDDGGLGSGLISTITKYASMAIAIGFGLSQVENMATFWHKTAWPTITNFFSSLFGGGGGETRHADYSERHEEPEAGRDERILGEDSYWHRSAYRGLSDLPRGKIERSEVIGMEFTSPNCPDVREGRCAEQRVI